MRSSTFGYVLVLGVFAATACTVETKITSGSAGSAGTGAGTGGDAGMNGGGKSGSAGQGGSGGSAGSAETGGASEAGAAGATDTGGAAGSAEAAGEAGAGGSSGASSTCDTSGFEFPKITCDSGSLSEFTNPTCQDLFLCMGIADCAASSMDCAACLDYLKVAFASTDSCIKSATQASLADACKMIAAESATQYPRCAPK